MVPIENLNVSVLSVFALLIASANEKDKGPTGVKTSKATPLEDLILLLSSTALE